MKKSSIFKKTAIGACALLAGACIAVGATSLRDYTATASVFSLDLFSSYDVNISVGELSPTDKNAVKFVPLQKGSSVALTNGFAGEFSAEFSVNGFEGTIEFGISDGDEAFSVGFAYTKNEVNAYVSKDGEKAGVHYEDGSSIGNTSIYNRNGTYTTFAAADVMKLQFDANSRSVYASNGTESFLVWDLSKTMNDGRSFATLGTLNVFDVTIDFVEYSKQTPELYVYALNGVSIGNGRIADTVKPSIAVTQSYDAIGGVAYEIPQPYVCDLVDGQIETVLVTVRDSRNKVILSQNYTDGLSFTPNALSEYYEITYSVGNSYGNTVSKTLEVLNYATEADAETRYVYAFDFEDGAVYTNRTAIEIPAVTLQSKVLLSDAEQYASFALYLDGMPVEGYENVTADRSYTFIPETAGAYKLVFSSSAVSTRTEKTFTVEEGVAFVCSGLKTYYGRNEVVSVPTGNVYAGGETVTATSKVIFPSGACYSNTEFVAKEKGKYTIVYEATLGGVTYEYEKNFTVVDSDKTLFESDSSETVMGFGYSNVTEKVSGLHVQTGNNTTVTYANVIDLSKLTRNDLLLELMADVAVIGTPDFNEIIVTLTDIYDPANYVTISSIYSTPTNSAGNGTYIKTAASCGQIMQGWYGGVNTTWGYDTRHSFIGLSNHGDIANNTLKLYFDNEQLRLYSGPTWGMGLDVAQDYMVADYDDTYFYSVPWDGFTTGEVYLSIKVTGATRKTVGYTVSTLAGESLTEALYPFASKPNIQIDYNGETEIPFGITGMDYKIFTATAKDAEASTELAVDTCVYYDYGKITEVEISYENGVFVPFRAGTYSVVYKATDKYGNTASEIVNVQVLKNSPDIAFELSEIDQELYVGQYGELPTILSSVNNSGNIRTQMEVADPDGQSVSVANGRFEVTKEGTYSITITGVDYLGRTGRQVVELEVSISQKPLLLDDLILPEYFLTEHTYALPVLAAKDYNGDNNGVDVLPKIYLTDDNNENVLLTDGVYKPQNTDAEEYQTTVKYVWTTEYGEKVYEKTIPTLKSKSGNEYYFANYFATTDMTKELVSDSIALSTEGSGSVAFAKSVLASSFTVSFAVAQADVTKIDALTITLKDSASDVTVKIRITMTASGLFASFNGGTAVALGTSIYDEDKYQIEISLSGTSFIDGTENILSILKTDAAGKEFTGFPSKELYFSMDVETNEAATVYLMKINNQAISNQTRYDRASAEIMIGSVGGLYDIGSTVTLTPAYACDVLSDIAYFNVSVTDEKGNYVTDTDGNALQNASATETYTFVLNGYGVYSVTYTAKDQSVRSQPASLPKQLIVVDRVAPEIKVNGTYAETYSLGTVKIFSATVTDNLSENLTYSVFVVDPSGKTTMVTTSYKFAVKGKHHIRYFAFDEAGNTTVENFDVTVR